MSNDVISIFVDQALAQRTGKRHGMHQDILCMPPKGSDYVLMSSSQCEQLRIAISIAARQHNISYCSAELYCRDKKVMSTACLPWKHAQHVTCMPGVLAGWANHLRGVKGAVRRDGSGLGGCRQRIVWAHGGQRQLRLHASAQSIVGHLSTHTLSTQHHLGYNPCLQCDISARVCGNYSMGFQWVASGLAILSCARSAGNAAGNGEWIRHMWDYMQCCSSSHAFGGPMGREGPPGRPPAAAA